MINTSLLSNYQRWKLILEKSATQEPKSRLQDFEQFLSHFPFSSKTWNQLAHLKLVVSGKEACLETYHQALKWNPNLLPLHLSYCLWVEDAYREDVEFVEKTYKTSLQKLTQNFEADKLYNFYIKFLNRKMKYKQCNDVFWELLRGNMFNVKDFVGR